ncbi:MAG: hypothetical protein SGJ09_11005 [Phycisphaerae bacterium]|nr:hypothetical protein [Phycisphaerae bacterium]
MKIKGISFFEQHVEKFAAGAAGLVLLGVLGMQFVASPNRVTMEGKDVEPGDIEPRLKLKAEEVRAKLSESGGTKLVDEELPKSFDEFKAALAGGISPRRQLPPTEAALIASLLPGDATLGEKPYYVPALGAPSMVAIQQVSDTLDDTVVQQYKELADRYASRGAPYDITWAIPVAELDLKALRAEYRKSNPAATPPTLAVPPIWFADSLFLVDMVFERQELRADGTWGEPATVAVLPGHYTFRPLIPKADAGTKDAVFNELSQPSKVREILQPEFLLTKGSSFSSSSVLGENDEALGSGSSAEAEDVRRLKREAARLASQIARVDAELKDRGGPLEPEGSDQKKERERKDREDASKDKNKDKGGGAAPPGGGGLGGGMGPGKNKDGVGQSEEDKKKRIGLTKTLKKLKDKLDRINAELAKVAPGAAVSATAATRLLDPAKDDKVLVWAHDIDVVPGATYRYRSRVDGFNPFFARKRQLVKEQQVLADRFVLNSKWSQWSEPVAIQPPVAFFVADAGAGEGRLGFGSAKIEVFRFFDGQRRSESFSVQPGDRIGDVSEKPKGGGGAVDFSTDWYVVAIIEDAAADRGDRRSAQVVVRRVGDSELVVRSPRQDLADDERSRFADEVAAARLANEDARDDNDKKPKDSSKDGKGDGKGGPGAPAGGGFGGSGSGGAGRPGG